MRTRVKICGITRAEDAAAAAALGADALGFVFYAGSKRAVTPERAREIIAGLPPFVTPVGVFVDATVAEILRTAARTGIRCLQLHGCDGAPPPEFAVIRAFRTSPDLDTRAVLASSGAVVLLDGYSPQGRGGTGTLADWGTAATLARARRLLLSGGLRPSNVAAAIRTVAPWGVDVSSGVERSPGEKDPVLMEEFFQAVRAAQEAAPAPQGQAPTTKERPCSS